MTGSIESLIFFIFLGIIVSIVSHIYVKPYLKASLIAATLPSLVFCTIVQVYDPTPYIVMIFTYIFVFSSIISFSIGLLFFLKRFKKLKKSK